MASKLSEEYPIGCVVWYKYSNWPWWPSKVITPDPSLDEGEEEDGGRIAIECFKTRDEYLLEDKESTWDKVKPFVHEDVQQLVIKEKKSCRNKKNMYKEYCDALCEAVDYMKERTGNTEFSLGIDPYADVSSVQKKRAPPKGGTTPEAKTMSLTKKSSSTVKRTVTSDRKRPRVFSASPTNKRGKRSRDVNASPVLAVVPCSRTTGSQTKRSRGTAVDRSEDMAPIVPETKRQRTCSPPLQSNDGERKKEPVPKKLKFNDDDDGLEERLAPKEDNPILESCTSPVDKDDGKPSSPCGVPLTNGHTTPLLDKITPIVNGVEATKPVTNGDEKLEGEEEEREVRGESAALRQPLLSGRSDEEDEQFSDGKETEECSDSDDDDDSMPTFSCDIKENLTVRQLKKNSIIWVQYSNKFPYWPALVTDVKKSSSKNYIARVLFFGYAEKTTTPVRSKKKIAPFATKRYDQFVEEGTKSEYSVQFEQAVEEAKTCMDFRLNPDKSTSTPRKLFDKVAQLRPKEYTRERYECPMQSIAEESGADVEEETSPDDKEDKQDHFLTGRYRLPFFEDSDEETKEDASDEEEEEDPVYGYEHVMSEVELFKPVLVDITQGKVESEFHRMHEGTRKEQNQLKVAPKAGPLCKWSVSKLTNLVVKLKNISEEASDGKLSMSYAYSVLLPEFVIRVLMKFDGVSETEAVERLDYRRD